MPPLLKISLIVKKQSFATIFWKTCSRFELKHRSLSNCKIMYYFGNLCVTIISASLNLYLLVRTMLKVTLKTLFSIFAAACLLFNVNVGHAGGAQSSAGGTTKGGGGSCSGGGASGNF